MARSGPASTSEAAPHRNGHTVLRTVKVRVFPSRDALLRLVSAVLAEIDDEWLATDRRDITWEDRDA